MDKNKRLEYLITTLCVLVSGFIIYGLAGSIGTSNNEDNLESFMLFGLLGGFGFSLILSTIILTVRFFSKRNIRFKIIAAILWPITFACLLYTGIIIYIPYQIYNIIKIIKSKPKIQNKKRKE